MEPVSPFHLNKTSVFNEAPDPFIHLTQTQLEVPSSPTFPGTFISGDLFMWVKEFLVICVGLW